MSRYHYNNESDNIQVFSPLIIPGSSQISSSVIQEASNTSSTPVAKLQRSNASNKSELTLNVFPNSRLRTQKSIVNSQNLEET